MACVPLSTASCAAPLALRLSRETRSLTRARPQSVDTQLLLPPHQSVHAQPDAEKAKAGKARGKLVRPGHDDMDERLSSLKDKLSARPKMDLQVSARPSVRIRAQHCALRSP